MDSFFRARAGLPPRRFVPFGLDAVKLDKFRAKEEAVQQRWEASVGPAAVAAALARYKSVEEAYYKPQPPASKQAPPKAALQKKKKPTQLSTEKAGVKSSRRKPSSKI